MLNNILILTASFVILIWSADRLIHGASGLAVHFQLPPLLVGLTLVAFGTSAPEIIVAIRASIDGLTDLAIGNAIGSNIANIGLVLGLTILIRPITVHSSLIRKEYPILFIAMLFTFILVIDGYLGAIDGALLLLLAIGIMIYLLISSRQSPFIQKASSDLLQHSMQNKPVIFYYLSLTLGLIFLPASAHFIVKSSADIARILGVSELTIGLTIIALGTSLPELITSIVATLKGADDIAIGNILGSNMFNLLAVVAFPAIIHPAPLNTIVLWRDIPIMFVLSIILFWMNYTAKRKLFRWQGGLLLMIYLCYMFGLIIDAQP